MRVINTLQFILFLFAITILQFSCNGKEEKYKPIEKVSSPFLSTQAIPDKNFIGSEKCKECHVDQFKSWEGSHHDKAMQTANRSTILAAFAGESFKSQGVTSTFFEKENNFYVNTEGPDGNYYDYKIVYTFGIEPLQQYIVQFPDGKYQCLRTAWDVNKNKWFDLYPDFRVVHSEWLHWSRGALNWNNMCSDCHSTNVRKNYNQNDLSYNTKFAVNNVSCEACHGPGKQHITAIESLGEKYNSSNSYMQMTSKTSSKELVDQCARCHVRREQISENFNFEGTFLDHYFPQLIESPVYHVDGQILDEDYVYGSFIQSKMYQNNVSCKDCHDSHSLKLKFDGNKLCLQCHEPKKYDVATHNFHEGISKEATKCINCHMTGKYYMGNDFRRDHSFRIPRPDLSMKFGTPNACNECHTDKDNNWTWEAFQKQYGIPDYKHFSEDLALGLTEQSHDAHNALIELVKDSTQPEIARASAVKALANYNMQTDIKNYIELLNNPSAIIRGATLDVLGNLNASDFASYLLPKLNDDKRSVRVKAFYALAGFSKDQVSENYTEIYKKVEKEFFSYLKVNADFSGGQIKKGSYYQKKGDLEKAKESYLNALTIDLNNNIARSYLANIYYALGDYYNAEKAFREVIKQEPEFGLTYYSLGLLLAEINRTEDAIKEMEKAYTYLPTNMRVIYNLSLLYNKNGDFKKAEKILLEGIKLYPENEDLLYALAYHYSTQKQQQKALQITQKLLQLSPNNSTYQTLQNSLEINQ